MSRPYDEQDPETWAEYDRKREERCAEEYMPSRDINREQFDELRVKAGATAQAQRYLAMIREIGQEHDDDWYPEHEQLKKWYPDAARTLDAIDCIHKIITASREGQSDFWGAIKPYERRTTTVTPEIIKVMRERVALVEKNEKLYETMCVLLEVMLTGASP